MPNDTKRLSENSHVAESAEDRLQLLREYVAFRLFAFYQGSRVAFVNNELGWKQLLAEIGERVSDAVVRSKIFKSKHAFADFVDQRGIEYRAVLAGSSTNNDKQADKSIFELSTTFGKHVQTLDIAELVFWSGTWTSWASADKYYVENVLAKFKLV